MPFEFPILCLIFTTFFPEIHYMKRSRNNLYFKTFPVLLKFLSDARHWVFLRIGWKWKHKTNSFKPHHPHHPCHIRIGFMYVSVHTCNTSPWRHDGNILFLQLRIHTFEYPHAHHHQIIPRSHCTILFQHILIFSCLYGPHITHSM